MYKSPFYLWFLYQLLCDYRMSPQAQVRFFHLNDLPIPE